MKDFIIRCINNRNYLGFSCKDIASCLIDMSEMDYKEFERGNYVISRENAKRLIRLLCIEKEVKKDIDKYLDFSNSVLNEEEKEDIRYVTSEIIGEEND